MTSEFIVVQDSLSFFWRYKLITDVQTIRIYEQQISANPKAGRSIVFRHRIPYETIEDLDLGVKVSLRFSINFPPDLDKKINYEQVDFLEYFFANGSAFFKAVVERKVNEIYSSISPEHDQLYLDLIVFKVYDRLILTNNELFNAEIQKKIPQMSIRVQSSFPFADCLHKHTSVVEKSKLRGWEETIKKTLASGFPPEEEFKMLENYYGNMVAMLPKREIPKAEDIQTALEIIRRNNNSTYLLGPGQ